MRKVFFRLGYLHIKAKYNELVTPYHLLNIKSENDQYFAYFNNVKNTFISHGINAGWALGIFQDDYLRSKIT